MTDILVAMGILAALVAAAILIAVRRRRHRNSVAASAAAALDAIRATRLVELEALLDRIEQDDVAAYELLREPVPGLGEATWRDFGSKHSTRYSTVVSAFDTRVKLRTLVGPLTENTAVARDTTAPVFDRLRAIVGALATLKGNFWYRHGAKLTSYISLEDAESLFKELMEKHIADLAQRAEIDEIAFRELYDLRLECHITRYHQVSDHYQPIGHTYETRGGWIFPPRWRQLVSRHIKAPSVWDFGDKNEYRPADFVHDLVTALRTGDQAEAKLFRAYLLESHALFEVTPGQLISAMYLFAETGHRPQLDLIFATEPVPESFS